MILNPLRIIRCALIQRQLENNLKARRTARQNGSVYVGPHTRRKA